jgi:hypothetical protein
MCGKIYGLGVEIPPFQKLVKLGGKILWIP